VSTLAQPSTGYLDAHEEEAGGRTGLMWSAFYWAAVGLGTLIFGLDIVFVSRGRESARIYPEAIALYGVGLSLGCGLGVLVIVLSRGLNPRSHPHFWAGTPTVAAVGGTIVLLGGHALAFAWDTTAERRGGRKPVLEHDPTPEELVTAEAYDAEWQIEDRKRNRRLGSGPRL